MRLVFFGRRAPAGADVSPPRSAVAAGPVGTGPCRITAPASRVTLRRKAEREAGNLNHIVQIYAHEPVFYRKDRPKLIDEYRARQHRHFTTSRNIVENIVHDMPGVRSEEHTSELQSLMRNSYAVF